LRQTGLCGVDEFDTGFLIGLLVGEGHFGGDRKQPYVIIKMHVRHKATFRWLQQILPGGHLYGPYFHGGRTYYQFMVRGRYLRDVLVPLIQRRRNTLDPHVAGRFDTMCARYGIG
jgi:hypothetical protein